MELDKELLKKHVWDRTKTAIIFNDPDKEVYNHLEELGYYVSRKKVFTILDLSKIPPSKIAEFHDVRPKKGDLKVKEVYVKEGNKYVRKFLIDKDSTGASSGGSNTATQSSHLTPSSATRYPSQVSVVPTKVGRPRSPMIGFMNKRLLYEVMLNNINDMDYEVVQSLHSFLYTDGKKNRVKRTVRLPKSMYSVVNSLINSVNKKYNVDLNFNDLVEMCLPIMIRALRTVLNADNITDT